MRTQCRPCHPEGLPSARPRRIRNPVLLALVPLALIAAGCEDLPEVPNIPPTASFIFNPVAPITAGETPVTFSASGQDTDGTIASYIWNFGDGTPEESTTTTSVTHVFVDKPGVRCVEAIYAVQLTVVDDDGDSTSASEQVTVIEAPPPSSVQCAGQ
jgi:PKD repeat protein